jgi:hypothetical protein
VSAESPPEPAANAESGAEIPVLRDVVAAPPGALASSLRRLDRDARAALSAEAQFLIDELLDEFLPVLEARLRERLEQRVREWLEQSP